MGEPSLVSDLTQLKKKSAAQYGPETVKLGSHPRLDWKINANRIIEESSVSLEG